MILKVIDNSSVFEDNPELKSVPQFMAIKEKEMRYIILAYGYGQVTRQLQGEERRIKSAKLAGLTDKKGSINPHAKKIIAGKYQPVQDAIDFFLEYDLHKDDDMEDYEAYKKQLAHYRVFLRKEDKSAAEIEKSLKILKEMPDLKKKLIELKKISNIDFDNRDHLLKEEEDRRKKAVKKEEDERGEESLSTVEKFNLAIQKR